MGRATDAWRCTGFARPVLSRRHGFGRPRKAECMAQSPQGSPNESVPSCGRRNFLKQSMVSLGVTVQEYVRHRDAEAKKNEEPERIRSDWLRPPGALDEVHFLESCTGCGDCVVACPHGSIRVLKENETPVIYPDEKPCYLCNDFPCIAACEPEALQPVGAVNAVAMGIAVVSQRLCTAGQGCNACLAQCPTRAIDMDFVSMSIHVDGDRCVGCGMCEYTCKTVNDRIAIAVSPERAGILP